MDTHPKTTFDQCVLHSSNSPRPNEPRRPPTELLALLGKDAAVSSRCTREALERHVLEAGVISGAWLAGLLNPGIDLSETVELATTGIVVKGP